MVGFEIVNFSSNPRISEIFVALLYGNYSSPYYRRHPKEFELERSGFCESFNDSQFLNSTNLRLTLRKSAGHHLLETVYLEPD